MRCIIIAAGELGGITREQIAPAAGDFVICCDGGYAHGLTLGIRPDLLMGDFDSFHGELPTDLPVLRFQKDKDDTDTLLAVQYGLAHGHRDFLLVAGTGGRLDHTYANLQILAYLLQQGARARILGGWEEMMLLKEGSVTLKRREGYTLSLFAFTEQARGVTLTGVYFPLTDATLQNTYPLGVSNRIVEPTATVEVGQGVLLILQCRDN